MFQVKSFIETQRALLTEIQNGCKRNFILAKEKEETEEKMRLSASMAEIATEDGTREEEEDESASAGSKEDETTENKSQTSSQSETSPETTVPPGNLDSDSDTEDEGEVVTTSCSSVVSNQTAPPTQTALSRSPLIASPTTSPPSTSPTRGPSVISGITVTETTVPAPPGTPPSPGRCISVSSPGRGHKIFMVTRVESPPEQLQKVAPAASCQYLTTQQTHPAPTPKPTQLTPEGTKSSPPAPSTDSEMTEETPKERPEMDAAHTHTPDPLSSEDAKARTLDPAGVTDPNLPTPALPSNSSSVPDVALKPTSNSESRHPEPTSTEGSNKVEEHEENVQDGGQGLNQPRQQQPPQTSAQEQLIKDQAAEPAETPPPNQTEADQQPPSTSSQPEDAAEVDPSTRVKDEESTDESSADESFVEALDREVVGSTLPNGLKPEFSLHLLDSETPKPGSCVMEHGECLLLFGLLTFRLLSTL